MIRARKLEVLEEKRQKAVDAVRVDDEDHHKDEVDEQEVATGAEESGEQTSEIKEATKTPSPKSTPESATTSETIQSISGDDDDDDSDAHGSSSPIETELDISLASISDDHYGSPPPVSEIVIIPGLGFDPRDCVLNPPSASTSSSSAPTVVLKKEKDRGAKHERKHKSTAYKKISVDKSKEKEAFRNQIANVVVTHLNPYKKQDCKTGRITKTEDFKHLARKV